MSLDFKSAFENDFDLWSYFQNCDPLRYSRDGHRVVVTSACPSSCFSIYLKACNYNILYILSDVKDITFDDDFVLKKFRRLSPFA